MAMIRRLSNTEIEELCTNVCRDLNKPTNDSDSSSLTILRHICGKNTCGCSNIVPSQELSYLLELLRNCNELCDYDIGQSIINNNTLANLSHCQSALEYIVRHSLNDSSSEKRNIFLEKLWTNPVLTVLKTDLITNILLHESKFLEEDMFNTFKAVLEEGVEPELVWRTSKANRVVLWSCRSASIFCVVTSVLNTWLHTIVRTVKQYEACVSVVSEFINRVTMECAQDKIDFVLLYPNKCHSLVSLLVLKPDLFPTEPLHTASVTLSSVLLLIKENLNIMPHETLCLLTHFPDWSHYISR